MLRTHFLNEARVLSIVDVGTKGDFFHCEATRNAAAPQRLDVIRFTQQSLPNQPRSPHD